MRVLAQQVQAAGEQGAAPVINAIDVLKRETMTVAGRRGRQMVVEESCSYGACSDGVCSYDHDRCRSKGRQMVVENTGC